MVSGGGGGREAVPTGMMNSRFLTLAVRECGYAHRVL